MTEIISTDDQIPVYIELSATEGEEEVFLNTDQLLEKSTEGLNKAMVTIVGMSKRVKSTIQDINVSERPDEIQVEFGIKVRMDGSAIVVKGGGETNIQVTLIWKQSNTDD